MRSLVAAVGTICLLSAVGATALAREPQLDVRPSKLRASLFCQESVARAQRTPVLLVTGTGSDGSETWPDGLQRSLVRDGIPSCYVDFPRHTTEDLQISVQYLVHAIRTVRRRAGRDLAVYGLSQGSLLSRLALTCWPSLRDAVADAVLLVGPLHGTTVFRSAFDACVSNCRFTASVWQQAAGSKLLAALNRPSRDETPGRTSWTTLRTLNDTLVQPTGGKNPTAALRGASNLVIQRVCPGRVTSHSATASDSVSYAALRDAVTHPGPARAGRIDPTVCGRPYAPGLDPERVNARLAERLPLAAARTFEGADGGRLLSREPPVRRYVRAH